ncbi:hypothetical protein [Sphingomonas bacterium]|uniref:hypothetical protein n=1 Tax=Sphingomonas bacterium TaxID=1895847 RepID=UPI0015770186|nr:hypothetical protein [Sphingomonas bacterium]
MAQKWCYLGALGPQAELDWQLPDGGNIPASGTLPDVHDYELWMAIRWMADSGRFGGKIIDWDAYGVKVNGPEVEQVLREVYAKQPDRLNQEPISLYLDYARVLGPDRYVALVAVAI